MYDTSVKVPCIMSQTGTVAAGKTCFSLLSQYDFMPTLLEYVGAADKIPSGLPGHSFCGLLDGGQPVCSDRAVYVFDEYGPVRMIRDTRYKYVHRYPYGENELYDLISDPGERQNLIDDAAFSDIAAEYKHKLELWFSANVNPEIDGSREAVTGFGQLGLAGSWGDGHVTYRR
jgi:arylsulfatase A-like enzyme